MDRFDWLELDSTPGIASPPAPSQKAAVEPAAMPKDAPTFYRAAKAMREAGHFKAATDFYRRAVGFDDHHFDAWIELVDTLVRARRIADADAASLEAYENHKQFRTLYASRALVLAHLGRFPEAMQFSDVSVDAGNEAWYAHTARGEILLRMDVGFKGEALALFEQATRLAQNAFEPAFIAGWALLEAKQYALAASYLAEAAHQCPRAPLAWLCLGDCFRELKFYEQALFYYQRVTELEPASAIALERQKECGSVMYGLMRAFTRDSLQKRWRREFDKLFGRE
jgi:tetratricopeptide (TPR) repeat protein